jgi:hypothetical protein
MYPQTHFLASLLIGMIFSKLGFFDYKIALLIGLAGMFVDIDHFITFVLKYKKMNIKHAWNKAVNGLYAGKSFIHHYTSFILITLIIAGLFFYNKTLFWIIGIGYYSHLFIDYAHLNILKIKGKIIIRKEGFIMKIKKFEVLLDIFLIIGIILLGL